MIKTLYFDLETTGLDEKKNSIIQFGAIVEYDGVEVERFETKFQPFDDAEVDEQSLEYHGVSFDDILGYQSFEDGFLEVLSFFNRHIDKFDKTDKFWIAGYNIPFDIKFLSEFFVRGGERYGLGSYINWRFIDPFPMIHIMAWKGKLKLPNHKLGTVCEAFKIPLKDAHDAMSDIEATRSLIKKLFG
jgi:DNA polymerase III subunit epsilon